MSCSEFLTLNLGQGRFHLARFFAGLIGGGHEGEDAFFLVGHGQFLGVDLGDQGVVFLVGLDNLHLLLKLIQFHFVRFDFKLEEFLFPLAFVEYFVVHGNGLGQLIDLFFEINDHLGEIDFGALQFAELIVDLLQVQKQ